MEVEKEIEVKRTKQNIAGDFILKWELNVD